MTTIKKEVAKQSMLPQRLEIGDKTIIDLKPLLTFLSYMIAAVLLIGGGTSFGAGCSYVDCRLSANRQAKYAIMTKTDAATVKIMADQMGLEDADVIAWRNKAPLPPAALFFGGLVMFGCGVVLGRVTIHKHCFEEQ